MDTTVLGFPHIGAGLELKKATEDYWAGRLGEDGLRETSAGLRRVVWEELRGAGLTLVPSNVFTLYDHVLDTLALFGAVPGRFAGLTGLDAYFAMARGADGVPPLRTAAWFSTKCRYLVPELGPGTRFHLAGSKPDEEYAEAAALGVETRPVLLGPLSFLLLSRSDTPGFRPLDLLEPLLGVYAELLGRLRVAGVRQVQFDEPVLAEHRTPRELDALRRAYQWLGEEHERPEIMVATCFGEVGAALPVLAAAPVEAVGLDFVAGPGNREALADLGGLGGRTLVAGVVDGRNVWRRDIRHAAELCSSLAGLAGDLVVGTSCSLRHVPLDLDAETSLNPRLRGQLAFARQKVEEVVLIGKLLDGESVGERPRPMLLSGEFLDLRIRAMLGAVGDPSRTPQEERRPAVPLPPLPATTVAAFPPAAGFRRARDDHRAGRIDDDAYERAVRAEIDRVIALQEDIGLDVLVYGETEVEYVAERLGGFLSTEHGWVRSSGSRYVRPPILYADAARYAPIISGRAAYAQSRTSRPVKAMLVGPMAMIAGSFVREDHPIADTARMIALALRNEIGALETAGIGIVQVDEPPPRGAYPDWAVAAFRLATSGAADGTQVHTHLCGKESGDLDADVTSVDAPFPEPLAAHRRGIGPGLSDPPTMERTLRRALETVGAERLWVTPDCGHAGDEAVLRAMTAAARRVRDAL